MKKLTKKAKKQMWKSIRRGVEHGAIKNHKSAAAASLALCRGFTLIYSAVIDNKVKKTLKALAHFEEADSSS